MALKISNTALPKAGAERSEAHIKKLFLRAFQERGPS
jgi:hypothetical protein